jgi:hypothetical protein
LDCIELHKLTIFSYDAAELQWYYMQQHVRKPQCVTMRAFVTCMGLLNDYLAYLLRVKDSSMAVEDTKKSNVPFNEADLARIMLKAVPTSWVNQYNLTHSTLPKSPRLLLPDLENIERVMNKKHADQQRPKIRMVQPQLVPSPAPRKGRLWAQARKSPRKLAPQGSDSIARIMAGPTRPTIPMNVASTTRMVRL